MQADKSKRQFVCLRERALTILMLIILFFKQAVTALPHLPHLYGIFKVNVDKEFSKNTYQQWELASAISLMLS